MSYTLSELIQSAATRLGTLALYKPSPVYSTTVTSTTIITDTTLALTADELIHGVAIVTYDAAGAGAAPEKEFQSITDNGTSTITVGTAFSSALGLADEIMIIRPKYPLTEWKRAANICLQSFGGIPGWDESLTMVSGQTNYTLPTTIIDPQEVWVQYDTTSDDWKRIGSWDIQDAAPGTARTLRIPIMYVNAGYKIGLVHHGDHPVLATYDDVIDIPIELVSLRLAWEMINRGGINARTQTMANKILAELNDAKARFKIPNKRPKAPKYLIY
jgi:hypothetical protein